MSAERGMALLGLAALVLGVLGIVGAAVAYRRMTALLYVVAQRHDHAARQYFLQRPPPGPTRAAVESAVGAWVEDQDATLDDLMAILRHQGTKS